MSGHQPQRSVEGVQRIEPARLVNPPEQIADLAVELSARSAKLGRQLHPRTAGNLADLVRIINTYYSNLIEGHNTRPRDIERALAGELDRDEARRNLQLASSFRRRGDGRPRGTSHTPRGRFAFPRSRASASFHGGGSRDRSRGIVNDHAGPAFRKTALVQ